MADIKHIEHDGFKIDVDMDVFDDVRFFELSDQSMTEPGKLIDIAKLAFGEDGYQRLVDYFTKKEGRLKMSKLSEIYGKIFEIESPKESASGQQKPSTRTN